MFSHSYRDNRRISPGLAGALLLFLLPTALLTGCSRPPEVVTFDLRKVHTPADVGWTPKDRGDVMWNRRGDFDLTFIAGEGGWRKFHQRCFSYGFGIQGGKITYVFAHFARGLTVEEALPVIRQALQDWAGGEREDVLPGDLSLDQFRDAVIADKYYREQWGVQGKDAGVVTLNFSGHEPRNAGLKRRCTLTFHP